MALWLLVRRRLARAGASEATEDFGRKATDCSVDSANVHGSHRLKKLGTGQVRAAEPPKVMLAYLSLHPCTPAASRAGFQLLLKSESWMNSLLPLGTNRRDSGKVPTRSERCASTSLVIHEGNTTSRTPWALLGSPISNPLD